MPVAPRRNIIRNRNIYVGNEAPFLLSPVIGLPLQDGLITQNFLLEAITFDSIGGIPLRYRPRLSSWEVRQETVEFQVPLAAEGVLKKISKTDIEIEIRYREGDFTWPTGIVRAPIETNEYGEQFAVLALFGGIVLLEPIGPKEGLVATILRPFDAQVTDDAIAPPQGL